MHISPSSVSLVFVDYKEKMLFIEKIFFIILNNEGRIFGKYTEKFSAITPDKRSQPVIKNAFWGSISSILEF